jgi:membrane-associated protease RseP (regulator of RpoE activity)
MYTISVMGVLGLHELGHLLACRIHNVKASLPLFIPGIPGITIGTFGAVVRQESPALNRNQLFDIGFSGPIFGFIAAIVVSYFGYSWSIPVTYAEYMSVVLATGPGQWIVPPAIFLALERFILPSPSSYTHFLHPVAWAGWICTLITFLNAFPIGQLDGGHVSRALLGQRWHKRLSYIMPVVMILAGWWQMALLALFFFRTVHPGALDDVSKVTRNRKIGGLLFILIFIACFTFTWESVIRMLLYP